MKTKLLVCTLLLLIPISLCFADKQTKPKHKHKYYWEVKRMNKSKRLERSIFLPIVEVNQTGNTLLLSFEFCLDDANITIEDKNGAVIYQQHDNINDGMTISIEAIDEVSCPLSIKIISPTTLIEGEIVEEE